MIMRGVVRESAIYSLGAGAAFAVDFALLYAQVELLSVHYLIAATLSFLSGTAVVYWVSVRHAFEHRSVEDRSTEFLYFTGIGVAGILLNLLLMASLVDGFGLHYLLAKIGSAAVTFVTNLGARKWLLFTRRPSPLSRGPMQQDGLK
jgi:putative flippase GtrA